ncbi:DUF2510 domain-containing protein [Microbacterium testaceum]|uniref:DUF2510 domain-containing protein n=1 Tax=Microbacterium testaceum TaxID=2033 RepID=UPI001CDA1885|nr:DUF2510 domain-containing protein [Microbacterium testaceum]
MTDTPTPPDGWYPDPAGGGGLRRWNGTGWTDEVRSASGEPVVPSVPHHDAGDSGAEDSSAGAEAHVAGGSAASEVASEPRRDHESTEHVVPSPEVSDAHRHDSTGRDGSADPASSLTASEPAAHEPAASLGAQEPAAHAAHGSEASRGAHEPAAHAAHDSAATPAPGDGAGTAAGASIPPVPPVTPPSAPSAPPAAPAYSSAPSFPSNPTYPSAPAYGAGAAAAGAAYGSAPGYPSASPVSYDAEPRRDIKTNTVWVWLLVFLPLLSVLGVVMFDWSSYIRDSFYAGVYSYESGDTSVAGTTSATTLITVVSSVVSLVVSALTVLFAFLDWRQLRARGVDRPFHWAWSFFVLAIGSGLVYIIGRGVILRRRTGSGLAPIWASIAVNVVAVIALIVWAVVLIAQVANLVSEFSRTYGY